MLTKLHFPSLRKGALVCSIAIVLAVILVFAYLVLQERRAEDLAEDFGNPESYLPSVTELGWSRGPSPEVHALDVRAVALGLLVVHSGGVFVLEGATGDEAWSTDTAGRPTIEVTPDGMRVVGIEQEEDAKGGEVVVLNAVSGGREARFATPEGADQHRHLLTSSHLLVSEVGELTAVDLDTGEAAWTYQSPSGCAPLPEFNPEEEWLWPIVTGPEHVFVAQACDSPGGRVHTVALDTATGEAVWQSQDMALEQEVTDAYAFVRVQASEDSETVVVCVQGKAHVLNAADGSLRGEPGAVDGEAFEDKRRLYVGAEHVVALDPDRSDEGTHAYVKYSYDGSALEQVQIPVDVHPPVEHYWAPQRRLAVVEEGIVVLGCADEEACGAGDSSWQEVFFVAWGADDPVRVEAEELSETFSSQYMNNRLVAVPGGVVAYQEANSGRPHGAFFGLL